MAICSETFRPQLKKEYLMTKYEEERKKKEEAEKKLYQKETSPYHNKK